MTNEDFVKLTSELKGMSMSEHRACATTLIAGVLFDISKTLEKIEKHLEPQVINFEVKDYAPGGKNPAHEINWDMVGKISKRLREDPPVKSLSELEKLFSEKPND